MALDPATPNSTPTSEPLTNTPQVLNVLAQPCAMIPLHVPTSEIHQAMGAATAELTAVLKDQGVSPTGPFYTHHLRIPDTHFDMEVCFPTAHPVTASGRVVAGEWPAGVFARTVYQGDYSGLVAAWGEFMAWIHAQGHKAVMSSIYERYTVGPQSTPDSKQWRTELNIGLTDAAFEEPPQSIT